VNDGGGKLRCRELVSGEPGRWGIPGTCPKRSMAAGRIHSEVQYLGGEMKRAILSGYARAVPTPVAGRTRQGYVSEDAGSDGSRDCTEVGPRREHHLERAAPERLALRLLLYGRERNSEPNGGARPAGATDGSRRTLTLDNGVEHTRHERTTRAIGVRCYFCHPYPAWARGTKENRRCGVG